MQYTKHTPLGTGAILDAVHDCLNNLRSSGCGKKTNVKQQKINVVPGKSVSTDNFCTNSTNLNKASTNSKPALKRQQRYELWRRQIQWT